MKKFSLILISVFTIVGIFAAGVDVAKAATGAALYSSYCSGCHPGNAKQGATTARINTAISNNTGGMGSLSTLTSADIQAIAAYLGGSIATTTGTTTGNTTGGTGNTTTTGATLYTGNCVSCHGSAGNLSGSSASQISNAISRNKGGMGKLASLTSSQIQTIADYLGTVSCSTAQTNTNSTSGGSAANNGSIATYDATTGTLNILSILVGTSTYTATLEYDGTCASSFCFKLTSATKTSNTPHIFLTSRKGAHSEGENNNNNNNNETNNENENDDITNSCTESSVVDSNSGALNISSVQVGNSSYHVALEYYGACDSSAAATCFKVTAVRQNQ